MQCLPVDVRLMQNGMGIRRVQPLLGHANFNTTSTYLRFKTADLLDMHNKIEFDSVRGLKH